MAERNDKEVMWCPTCKKRTLFRFLDSCWNLACTDCNFHVIGHDDVMSLKAKAFESWEKEREVEYEKATKGK